MILPLASRRNKIFWVAVLAWLLVACPSWGHAQENPVDLQAIIKESQQTFQTSGAMTLVWWMPESFFRAAISTNANLTAEKTEAFLKPLRDYTMVIVIDAKIGPIGGFTYTPLTELAGDVRLKDSTGNLYAPIDEAQINSDAKSFITLMKPMMAGALGSMGQNMNFFVFPSRGKDGAAIANEKGEGVFYVDVGKKEFRWRLPLSSILPRKVCPTCKESLSGAYKFCPYDGTKLPEPAAPQATPEP